ncbi:hypothetical protein C7S18_02305 [Ahniella affigens]|uniref:Uncharacterized protein n=1 Tax=Ahniella affigens TaxID=2021234 RepID=A0A2P1PMN5_9GAMM|nr:hypothetical protein [Ahniella affigens]AVP96096.1 hypothetical protein C7S18_02305 [Ahniella affigens]
MTNVAAAGSPTSDAHVVDTQHHVERFFQQLGDAIAAELGHEREDIYARLEDVAIQFLEQYCPAKHISHDDLIDYVLTARKLPFQIDLEAKFAEPPLSLYHGKHFDISALTWLDGTTSIHQHSFCGAFHVLSGSSIHSRYRFTPDREPAPLQRSVAGQLTLIDLEVLQPGDTRRIARGNALIHALFHMIRPSVTIVVRTITDDHNNEVQYDFRWPGIAFDPFQQHALTIRQIQYLDMLRTLRGDAADAALIQVLNQADLHLCYRLVSTDFLRRRDPERARWMIGASVKLSDRERELVWQAAYNDFVSQSIIDLRRRLHSPPHRFLLALLLNVFDREQLLGLIASKWNTDQPVSLIRTWMAEMCGLTDRFPNLLDLDMNETALNVLERLWHGDSVDATLDWFRTAYGAETMAIHDSTSVNFMLPCAIAHCSIRSCQICASHCARWRVVGPRPRSCKMRQVACP